MLFLFFCSKYVSKESSKWWATNKYLQSYCEENKFEYINIHDTLLDNEDNLKLEYTKEGLHVNDIGYHFITNILLKYFK